jgi:hypothetical protein
MENVVTTTVYDLWNVTTAISELEADHILGHGGYDPSAFAIYNDLGSGLPYSQVVVGLADNGTQIQIPLDGFALQSLNAAEGGSWAVGGSVTPEPASWVLMLLGFGAIACAGYRGKMGATPSSATAYQPLLRQETGSVLPRVAGEDKCSQCPQAYWPAWTFFT